jgi:hypothetical protein
LPILNSPTGFKFEGGYFMAAGGGSSILNFNYSPDLVNWTNTNLLGSVSPPIIDMACDGIYLYYLHKTSPTATATRLVRIAISTGISNAITLSVFAKTINVRSGGVVFYTYVGGYGYISSWPTAIDVPNAYIDNPAGFVPFDENTTGVYLDGPNGFYYFYALSASSSTSLDATGFGIVADLGATNIRVSSPVRSRIARSPNTNVLWVYMYDLAGTTKLRLYGARLSQPPFVISVDPASLDTTFDFGTISTKIPKSLVISDVTGAIYVAFDDGEIWKTMDFGTTWMVDLTLSTSIISMVSSSKGLVIAHSDRSLLISP